MKYIHLLITIFILTSCSSNSEQNAKIQQDLCEGIICKNGGSCMNGDCACAEGYQGPSCEDQITPTVIRINKITVTNFPVTNENGGGWDRSSGPDLIVLLEKGNNELFESSNFYQNAKPSSNYFWAPPSPIEITSPTQKHSIFLYDYDDGLFEGSNDLMGGFSFYPYSSSNNFPHTISFSSGELSVDFSVTYVF